MQVSYPNWKTNRERVNALKTTADSKSSTQKRKEQNPDEWKQLAIQLLTGHQVLGVVIFSKSDTLN